MNLKNKQPMQDDPSPSEIKAFFNRAKRFISQTILDQSLFMAAMAGDTELIRELVQKGANVNAANRNATTVLMFAAKSGSAKAVKLLIDLGANPDAIDLSFKTPYLYAKENEHYHVAYMLRNFMDRSVYIDYSHQRIFVNLPEEETRLAPYIQISLLHYAAYKNLVPLIRAILNSLSEKELYDPFRERCYGYNRIISIGNIRDWEVGKYRIPPINLAAYSGSVEALREFLKLPKIDIVRYDKVDHLFELSPLEIAALKGHVNVIREILTNPNIDKSVIIKLLRKKGGRAANLAFIRFQYEAMQELLKHPLVNLENSHIEVYCYGIESVLREYERFHFVETRLLESILNRPELELGYSPELAGEILRIEYLKIWLDRFFDPKDSKQVVERVLQTNKIDLLIEVLSYPKFDKSALDESIKSKIRELARNYDYLEESKKLLELIN